MAVDTDGASPLHYASVMSSNEVVTLLITEVNTLYIHVHCTCTLYIMKYTMILVY